MTDTLNLTLELIRCPSITPDDAGCMELIVARLEPNGFAVEWLDSGDTRNLWLKHGDEGPLLVFLGHTDVVPSGPVERWQSPPFEPSIRDGMLYGRGAADMKSGVAAMTIALERFVTQYPDHKGSVALLLTSDEEGDATHGVVKVMETFAARGEKIDWCLVGEPSSTASTGDVIRVGRRGSLSATLRVCGVQGHVAYPDRADNPIHRLAPVLAELCTETWDEGNHFFPPTSFQASNIHAGTGADNVIPGQLDLVFNFRYSTAITETEIRQRVESMLDRHGITYELEWRSSGGPFLTTQTTLIKATQDALRLIQGHTARLDTGGGTSDGRFVAPTGAEVVELGPLNASIHKIDECIAVEEPETLASIYHQIMVNLLIE
ncbi:MAG: succinyl-diaminopimelate desuccinylase [Methylococcaceae bacterium]